MQEIEDHSSEAILVTGDFEIENGGPELANRLINLVDGVSDSAHHLGLIHQPRRAMQRKADGEEPLNHRIMQVAGNAVSVFGQRALSDDRLQSGFLYRDAGRHGENLGRGLVLLRELGSARFVREIQIAEYLIAHSDGYAKERRHMWMMRREPAALGRLGQLNQPKRRRVGKEPAQYTSARRNGSDRLDLVRLKTNRDELLERGTTGIQDAEGSVTCVNQGTALLDKPVQDHGEDHLALQGQYGLHQAFQSDGVVNLVERLHGKRVAVSHRAGPRGRPSVRRLMVMTIRIFLLDDHELVRTGLRTLLAAEDDMEVVGEAGTAELGLTMISELQPDVAILDVRLPDGNGIEVCREVQSIHPQVRCLMLTSYSDDEALYASIMAGAAGYVLKEVGSGDLVGDIRRVHQGVALLDRALTSELIERLRETHETASRLDGLTVQERRVLELIAQGRSNRQIANDMNLAEATVKNYVSNLLSKLGMQRRTEAAVYAAVLAERKSTTTGT
jgi:two-component system response regulator DevR